MISEDHYSIFEKFKSLENMLEGGHYQEAKIQISKLKDQNESKFGKLYLLIFSGKLARLNGDYKNGFENLRKIENDVLSTNAPFLKTYYFAELCWLARWNGEMIQSKKFIALAELYIKDIKHDSDYFKNKKIQFNAVILHNKAVVLMASDSKVSAILTAYESLKSWEKIGHKQGMADALNNIGVMHWHGGEINLASEQLGKCYVIRKEIGIDVSLVLLNLVQLNVQRGDIYLEIALSYYKEFEEFEKSNNTNNKQVKNYLNLAKAVYLKSSSRFKDKVEAENIFYTLIKEDELDHQHIIYTYYFLADLLFHELSSTGNKEILEELRILIDNLSQMGEERKIEMTISRASLLKSKLNIIDGDIVEAKKSLTIALNLALKGRDNRLLFAITTEYDKLFRNEKDVMGINSETPFHERIDIAGIDQLVSQLNQGGTSENDEGKERPILFMVMMDVGTLLYSQSFIETSIINENLISNFIGAINNFGNEIFSSSGYIEGIKHNDYTILMKSVGVFIFSYIFKGSSFAPSKKLKEISEKIIDLNFLTKTQQENRVAIMETQVKNQISNFVSEVILNET